MDHANIQTQPHIQAQSHFNSQSQLPPESAPAKELSPAEIEQQEYIEARNALIPEAEEYANKIAGKHAKTWEENEKWGAEWNFAFHTKMNELAIERGVVKA